MLYTYILENLNLAISMWGDMQKNTESEEGRYFFLEIFLF
jgi:hypothetical protein